MRWALVVLLACCGKDAAPTSTDRGSDRGSDRGTDRSTDRFDDLGKAILSVIPADARVIGFGELHSRTDRASAKSSLSAFTAALPAFADKLSDLVVETWLVDGKCGSAAVEATAHIEQSMRRPEATKSEIARLAEAARAAKVQPHPMRVTCDDYALLAPPGKEPDPAVLLTFTTNELRRVTSEALSLRDAEPAHRPWIAVYGGALHNDRFPAPGVEDWSYAAAIDKATRDHFVEIDLIVPELAELDPASQKTPWFSLVKDRHDIAVWKRGERSFVIVLPRGAT